MDDDPPHGALLGCSWGDLGRSWGRLEALVTRGALLGPSLGPLRTSGWPLGAILEAIDQRR
eukprot:4207299-Pyramimonas_sp.AAC.1